MKILIIYLFTCLSILQARELGQTEITAEEGMEVYQKEKFYILKQNVEIESDNFKLKAQKVKAHFDKDLYDITNIYSQGNVIFESNQGLKIIGSVVDHNIKKEQINIKGEESFLQNKDFTMISNRLIEINNISGNFKLYGKNSKLITNDITIVGENIEGKYMNIDGENIIDKLNVKDTNQVNIKTTTSDMFAKKAIYNKQENTIELFDNVVIIRNNESVTGDYAKMNTLDESYFVKTNYKSKRVKAVLEETNE